MSYLKICLDDEQYSSKAECSNNAGRINNRLAKQVEHLKRSTLANTLARIGVKGQTFCPATFKNDKRTKDSFEQTRLFVLDFDDKCEKKISFDDVKKRAEDYELPILYAYETLSSTNSNRYRVLFMNEEPVTDIKEAQVIQDALMTIFPEADSGCRSVVQMYYGGKKHVYTNPLLFSHEDVPQINTESVIRNLTSCLKDRYKINHYKRKVAEFAKIHGIRLNNRGLLDITIEDNVAEKVGVQDGNFLPFDDFNNNINELGRKLPNKPYRINFSPISTTRHSESKKSNYHLENRQDDLRKVPSVCRLFQDFISGNRQLPHDELFGLATNLIWFESGISEFKRIIRHHSYFDERPAKYSRWSHDLNYMKPDRSNLDKKTVYSPRCCDNYCRYKDSCVHGTNIISTVKVHKNHIEKLANHTKVYANSIEEAAEDFLRQFRHAFFSNDKLLYAIKAQTGIGKTKMLLEVITEALEQNPSLKVLIAVPTNVLKHEVRERAEAVGIEIIESPSLREYEHELPDYIWDHIECHYKSGKSPFAYMRKEIASDNYECAAIFKDHLNQLDAFYRTENQSIATHKRALNMDFSKYDIVIIDEDIVYSSIIPNKISISISSLKKLRKKITPESAISKKIKQVLDIAKKHNRDYQLFTLPQIECDIDNDDIPLGFDISSFCSATEFVCHKASGQSDNELEGDCISFYIPDNFKKNIKDTKVIMVSATLNETILNLYFGSENVDCYECKEARNTGTIRHYHDRTYSRSDIAKDPNIIPRIMKWSGNLPTITFKKYAQLFLHFGNLAGCDKFKGVSMNVIGIHNQPEWVYKLFAASMGLDFDRDAKLKNMTVEHNGFKFRFMTFDDEILRAVQFYMIESEQEQAVGRSRLLREDCYVNLFSPFPLPQSELMEAEYDKVNEK